MVISRYQCSICRGERDWGFKPPLVDDDPPLVTAKFGLGVGFEPLSKIKYPNSSLNRYKLMSNIIQIHPSDAKNTVMTYLSLHLIANKTLELVHENAPECTILKF